MDNLKKKLAYAKENISSFEKISVSSNEIYVFNFEDKKYILKIPLMIKNNLSPFWLMMKNIFLFTFEKQNLHLKNLYDVLKNNPHIKIVPFVASDEYAMIYEFVEDTSWSEDEFPCGKNNAYTLGQYIGYNHQVAHKNCGIIGIEDVEDFYSRVLLHAEECINQFWNTDSSLDKKVRNYFKSLTENYFTSSKNSLIMVDICADQFLFENETVTTCIDLDGYVIGPVEWELSFLKTQIKDWDSFKSGYETYQPMPEFEKYSQMFFFLMALNSYNNKQEMEGVFYGNGYERNE